MEEILLVYAGYAESNRYIPRMFMIARREQDVEEHLNKRMDARVSEIIMDVSQRTGYDAEL